MDVIHARGNLEAFVGARFVRPALRPSVPKGDEPPPFGADDLRLLILFSIFCHKFYPFPDPYPPRDFWWEFWWDFFIPKKKCDPVLESHFPVCPERDSNSQGTAPNGF